MLKFLGVEVTRVRGIYLLEVAVLRSVERMNFYCLTIRMLLLLNCMLKVGIMRKMKIVEFGLKFSFRPKINFN